jgi:CBS domain containing-hemolysin-like protein
MSERDTDTEGDRSGAQPRPSLLDRLRALFGLAGASVRDDIQEALEDNSDDTDFSPQERLMLKNVLGLREVRVGDVMVPRPDIIAVSIEDDLQEILLAFRTAGHSRLPVHGDTLDDPRGMIHIRDLIEQIAAAPPADLPKETRADLRDLTVPLAATTLMRPVLFAPPSMPVLDLLVKMQATRTHMALVIDEYGGTEGLVSIEDIVEIVVGDIEDEHDTAEGPRIAAVATGGFVADARADLDEVSEAIGTDISTISDAEDVDTIGGLVTALAGHVPVRGEIIVDSGFEFEILDADPRRVKRIRILRTVTPAEATGDEANQPIAPASPSGTANVI